MRQTDTSTLKHTDKIPKRSDALIYQQRSCPCRVDAPSSICNVGGLKAPQHLSVSFSFEQEVWYWVIVLKSILKLDWIASIYGWSTFYWQKLFIYSRTHYIWPSWDRAVRGTQKVRLSSEEQNIHLLQIEK